MKKSKIVIAPEIDELDFIKTEIKYNIMKNLNFNMCNKSYSPVARMRISISQDCYTNFKKNYNLTGRFKSSVKFSNSFIVEKKRYFPDDKTSIMRNIEFKITKFKDLEVFGKNLKIVKVPRNCRLSIQFCRDKN